MAIPVPIGALPGLRSLARYAWDNDNGKAADWLSKEGFNEAALWARHAGPDLAAGLVEGWEPLAPLNVPPDLFEGLSAMRKRAGWQDLKTANYQWLTRRGFHHAGAWVLANPDQARQALIGGVFCQVAKIDPPIGSKPLDNTQGVWYHTLTGHETSGNGPQEPDPHEIGDTEMTKQQKAAVDALKARIAKDDTLMLDALVFIYNHQTEQEQSAQGTYEDNGVGFSGVDAEFLTSLAEQHLGKGRYEYNGRWYDRKGPRALSPKQLEYARKKMGKYAGQLVVNGFMVPDAPVEQAEPVVYQARQPGDEMGQIIDGMSESERAELELERVSGGHAGHLAEIEAEIAERHTDTANLDLAEQYPQLFILARRVNALMSYGYWAADNNVSVPGLWEYLGQIAAQHSIELKAARKVNPNAPSWITGPQPALVHMGKVGYTRRMQEIARGQEQAPQYAPLVADVCTCKVGTGNCMVHDPAAWSLTAR